MTKEELITFMKENLTLDISETIPVYGISQHFTLELKLCGESISGIDIMYERDEDNNYLEIYQKQY